MKTYISKHPVELGRKDFEKINKLLLVNFNDEELPEMAKLIEETDACRNTNPYTFWWNFEDGSVIIMDIYVGDENAYDDIRWYKNLAAYPQTFDRGYEIEERMVFECVGKDNNTYICEIKIEEDE